MQFGVINFITMYKKTGKMIYDYLFFKSYQLAQKSKNFEDAPVLGGIWFGVLPCSMLNLFTIILLIDTCFQSSIGSNPIFTIGKYFFAGIFLLIVLYYYRSGGRWKIIVARYEAKEKETGKRIHPAIVLIIAYIISFALGTLASMYKTGDLLIILSGNDLAK